MSDRVPKLHREYFSSGCDYSCEVELQNWKSDLRQCAEARAGHFPTTLNITDIRVKSGGMELVTWYVFVTGPKGTPYEGGGYIFLVTHNRKRPYDLTYEAPRIYGFVGPFPISPRIRRTPKGNAYMNFADIWALDKSTLQWVYDALCTIFFNFNDERRDSFRIDTNAGLSARLRFEPLATCRLISEANEREANGAKAVYFLPQLSSDSEYSERIDAIKDSCHSANQCPADVIGVILEYFGSYRAYRGLRHFDTQGATKYGPKPKPWNFKTPMWSWEWWRECGTAQDGTRSNEPRWFDAIIILIVAFSIILKYFGK